MLNQGSGRDGAQLIMDTISCDSSNLFTFPLKVQLNNNLLSKNEKKMRLSAKFYSIYFW